MIDWKGKKVLVLSPHTDDAELGAGGFISRILDDGGHVIVWAFSACGSDTLRGEFFAAMEELGVEESRLYGYKHRNFHSHRQDILEGLILGRREVEPDLVLCPSLNDIHQDHVTIAQEAVRAFKNTNIWAYEMPWNCLNFNTAGFVELFSHDIEAKLEACGKYYSQSGRPYMQEEAIEAQARMRGTQIGVQYAEAFEIIRQVIRVEAFEIIRQVI